MIGFLLGTARVLLLASRVGPTIAVCLETPFILAAGWGVSKMLMKRLGVDTAIRSRVLVGAIALVLLTILEIALG